MRHIIVIGGGQAGASCAFKLRSLGYEGELTLIGAESVPPYQRPPLSKAYLLGDMPRERLLLKPAEAYEAQGITLRLGAPVASIQTDERSVSIGDEALPYDALVLATGSTPIRLPDEIGGNLDGVFTIRGLADIDALAPRMTQGAKLLIVGGGYIGLEAAAVAAKLGLDTTLVEAADRILSRVAAPETSDYFRALHSAQGVNILEGTALQKLVGEGGKVTGAELSDGSHVEADLVIVGVGIRPETTLAEATGLSLENGIRVDAQGRTSDPHIWAAGDCTSFPYRGGRIRLESVPNAIEQAECVAANIMGAETDYLAKPWFWSDQYNIKLQIAGLNTGYDRVVTRIPKEGSQSHWYYAAGQLIAVDAMNDPRGYMVGKRLIEEGKNAPPEQVEDPSADLKALLRA